MSKTRWNPCMDNLVWRPRPWEPNSLPDYPQIIMAHFRLWLVACFVTNQNPVSRLLFCWISPRKPSACPTLPRARSAAALVCMMFGSTRQFRSTPNMTGRRFHHTTEAIPRRPSKAKSPFACRPIKMNIKKGTRWGTHEVRHVLLPFVSNVRCPGRRVIPIPNSFSPEPWKWGPQTLKSGWAAKFKVSVAFHQKTFRGSLRGNETDQGWCVGQGWCFGASISLPRGADPSWGWAKSSKLPGACFPNRRIASVKHFSLPLPPLSGLLPPSPSPQPHANPTPPSSQAKFHQQASASCYHALHDHCILENPNLLK